MNSIPDQVPENPPPNTLVEPQASSLAKAERSSAESTGFNDPEFAAAPTPGAPIEPFPPDPAWNAWDVLRLILLTLVSFFVCVFTVLLIARWRFYPHSPLGEIARIPLVLIAGQSLGYVVVLAYMYILVTRERRRPAFWAALHWNFPANVALYVMIGLVLSVALQLFARLLPIPKELPIDTFFRTPAEAWALGILSMTLAPLMEELFFRGFLYPVLARGIGVPMAIALTAISFALLHGAQLMFSWGPVLVIFLVGLVLTIVRARKNSVGASFLIHMAYNGTITVAMFAATDGFRHLEKLN